MTCIAYVLYNITYSDSNYINLNILISQLDVFCWNCAKNWVCDFIYSWNKKRSYTYINFSYHSFSVEKINHFHIYETKSWKWYHQTRSVLIYTNVWTEKKTQRGSFSFVIPIWLGNFGEHALLNSKIRPSLFYHSKLETLIMLIHQNISFSL